MGGSKKPGPIGHSGDDFAGKRSGSFAPTTPAGFRVRSPSVELFILNAGELMSMRSTRLSPRQIELGQEIFGSSIDFSRIRLIDAPLLNSPTTLGDFIRVFDKLTDGTLIHELTHVWQFQTRGVRYISNSLAHQTWATLTEGDRNAAYALSGTQVVEAGSIDKLAAEQQAMLVERWFLNGSMMFPTRTKHGEPTLERQMIRDHPACQHMLHEVRSSRPLSRSQIIDEAAIGPGANIQRYLDPSDRALQQQIVPFLRFDF